jgi:hypothetical protein
MYTRDEGLAFSLADAISIQIFLSFQMEQQALKNANNGRGSTINRAPDGSTYPG